jgi:thioesterase domain-containing protein
MSSSFHQRVANLSPARRRLLEQLRARRDLDRRPAASVVLRAGTGPRKLIMVHPSGGELFCYVPLTRALPSGAEVLGFTASPVDREAPVERRISVVAQRILASLREEVDLADCVLAGWSYGGSVAFEVARAAHEGGFGTPPVVSVDAPFVPTLDFPMPTDEEFRRQFVYDLARLHGVPDDQLTEVIAPDAPTDLPALLALAGVRPELTDDEIHDRYLTFLAAASALHRYQPPGRYPGRMYLLTAGTEPEITARWRACVSGAFEEVVLPGDHYTVFDPVNLPTVVRTVQRALTG